MTITRHAWIGRKNQIPLLVNQCDTDCNLVPVDFTSVTAADVSLGNHTTRVNQGDINPPVNWWDQDLAVGEVCFEFGHWTLEAGIPAGNYLAALVVYDPQNPTGIVIIAAEKNDFRVVLNQ